MCLLLGHKRYRSLSRQQHTTILFTRFGCKSMCVFEIPYEKRCSGINWNNKITTALFHSERFLNEACKIYMLPSAFNYYGWAVRQKGIQVASGGATCLYNDGTMLVYQSNQSLQALRPFLPPALGRSKRRIAVMYSGWPPLSKERRNLFFFLHFNPHQRGAKRRHSIPLLALVNHSFLGASAY